MINRFFYFLKGNIYVAMLLRLFIIYVLFSICRLAYYWYNQSFFPDLTAAQLVRIFIGGLKFDTTAILYVNMLFILGNTLPFKFRLLPAYQKTMLWIFMLTNSIALISNIADIPYYPFTFRRTTWDVFAQFQHEQNLFRLIVQFLLDYWYAVLFFIGLFFILKWMYAKVSVDKKPKITNNIAYYGLNTVAFLLSVALVIGGIRGGFEHSTRPITLSNATAFVENPSETVLVLNTPFSIIRTTDQRGLKKQHYFTEEELPTIYSPIHSQPKSGEKKTMNVVLFILESFGKEYITALNQPTTIQGYEGYTPFLDSLISQSLVYEYAFANGKKSIEALPSVLSAIPGMESPYVLTPYSYNEINSLPGLLAKEGYYTAFFHGAPNGSMGFDAFIKAAGVAHYFGKTEYANDVDFDGMWGIWDEPYFQYFATQLNTFKQPFCASLFSISSHHPFEVPTQYRGKLKEGPIPLHKCINYTDQALRKFFARAANMPWFKNTLFVFTADHAFFPHYDEYNNDADKFSIPLFFYTPNGSLKGRNDSIVAQQIDIMPTVLNYLGYSKPYVAFGNDLFSATKNDAFAINYINTNYQFFMGDYVLMYDGVNCNGLFNFKSDRALKFLVDNKKLENNMLRKAQAFIQQYNNRMVENKLTVK